MVTLLGYGFVIVDVLITGLILTAGADRVAQLMKSLGAEGGSLEKSEPKPIEVTGTLVLEERAKSLPNEASQKDWVGDSLPSAADLAIVTTSRSYLEGMNETRRSRFRHVRSAS